MVVLKLSGKAYQVFRYLELLVHTYGNITLAELEEEVNNVNEQRRV